MSWSHLAGTRAAAVLVLVVAAGQPTAATSAAAIPHPRVFTSGEGGYHCFRIPALVRTEDGELLAFAEGRMHDCDDTGRIDTVLKRSSDGGRHWGRIEMVSDGRGDTRGNPVPVVDRASGRITLLTTHNPGPQCGPNSTRCVRTPYRQHSLDNRGLRWSRPEPLAHLVPASPGWFATGPGHGLQLTRGAHAGRMVVGVNHTGGAALVLSDDAGRSWRLGARTPNGRGQVIQELNLLERVDGAVYAAARNNNGGKDGTDNRLAAVSADAGASFTQGFGVVPDLAGPVVQGSVVRLRATTAGDRQDKVVFAGPYNNRPGDGIGTHRRHTMRLRVSTDEGRTWQRAGTVVDAAWAGYSDLVNLGGGALGVLYEAGTRTATEEIRYARVGEGRLG